MYFQELYSVELLHASFFYLSVFALLILSYQGRENVQKD